MAAIDEAIYYQRDKQLVFAKTLNLTDHLDFWYKAITCPQSYVNQRKNGESLVYEKIPTEKRQ